MPGSPGIFNLFTGRFTQRPYLQIAGLFFWFFSRLNATLFAPCDGVYGRKCHLNTLRINGAFFIIAVVCTALILAFLQYTQDDVFITYTYSRNIAEGNGFVFNTGEQVQGTTTPLWTLVIALVYLFTQDLLIAGNLLSGAFLLATLPLVYRYVREGVSIYGRIALLALIVASPLFYISLGMETLFYGFLLMLAVVLWQAERRMWAIVAAGLLMWTRADGIVLAGVFGLLLMWDVITQRSRAAMLDLLKAGLIGFVTVAPWFIFALAYFGSLTPNTFAAKVGVNDGFSFITDGWFLLSGHYSNNPLMTLTIPAILFGLYLSLRNKSMRPLALWTVFYAIGYTILDTTEFWYYTPFWMSLLIYLVYGFEQVLRALYRRLSPRASLALNSVVALALIFTVASSIYTALGFRIPPQRTTVYTDFGRWIDASTPEDSTILLADLGIVGYYARRHAVDSFGLIVPEMYQTLPTYAALKYRSDYAVTTHFPPWFDTLDQEHFHTVYRPLFQIHVPEDIEFSPASIYERRMPLETPSTLYQGQPLGLNCTIDLPTDTPLPESIEGEIRTSAGDVIVVQSIPPFNGVYPGARNRTLGDELIREQLTFETGALPIGTYEWMIDCGHGPESGSVEILPLSDAPDVLETPDAQWSDAVSMAALSIANDRPLFAGGMLRLLLQWEGLNNAEVAPFWIGVELMDVQGEKRAEGICLPPEDMPTATQPEAYVTYCEIALPVVIPAADYKLEINRFLVDVWERIPLATETEGDVYPVPVDLPIGIWSPID